MIRYILFLLALATVSVCSAQAPIKSIKLNAEVVVASIDRPGDLYIQLSEGEIQHYDTEGKLLATLKGSEVPALFDPRDGSRLFAFYRKARRYDYLNPSFEETKSVPIDSSLIVEPWLVCPSGDHNIWAIDAADHTLKKINNTTSRVDAEISLKEVKNLKDIIFIREYQGFLFMHDREKGIVVYSGMGKLLKTIGDRKISYFNFLGEELYYLEGDKIQFFNLFNAEKRFLPIPKKSKIILLTDERLYSIDGKSAELFGPLH